MLGFEFMFLGNFLLFPFTFTLTTTDLKLSEMFPDTHDIYAIDWKLFLLIFSDTAARNIYVTQDTEGKDQKDCGSYLLPCRNIKFSITIAKPFDTILIDGGRKDQYEYKLNETLLIDKELILTSYNSRSNPNLTMKIDMEKYNVPVAFFKISKSFSLNALNIYPTERITSIYYHVSLLTMDTGNIDITLKNCTIKNINRLFNFTGVEKINVRIQDCVIDTVFSHPEEPMKSSFHSALKDTKISVFHNKTIVINVFQCHFTRAYIYLCLPVTCVVYIKRTTFVKSSLFTGTGIKTDISENSVFVESEIVQQPLPLPAASLIVQNVNFTGSSVYDFGKPSLKSFQMLIDQSQNVIIENCHFENSSNGVLLVTKSKVNITNSRFINNQQLSIFEQTAVVQFSGSSAFISGCYFDNNNAPMSQGGTIRFDHGGLYHTKILINDTIIKGGIQSQNFENSLVSIQASSSVTFFGNVNISCPVNYKLIYTYDKMIDPLKCQFFCKKCNSNKYSVDYASIKWNQTKQSFNNQSISCIGCPYEAICQQKIQSKGNYWGYKAKNNLVKFVYCPTLYCCTSPSSCQSYNTCYQNRGKRLCSECIMGYSVGVFGQRPCIETFSCAKFYFWLIYVFFIMLYTLLFMYIQEVFLFIKRVLQKLACFRRNPLNNTNENQQDVCTDFVSVDPDELSFQLVPKISEDVMEYPGQTYQISGIIKILFFFYQTASIIRINSSTKSQYFFPEFADILLSFFNIKIDINSPYIKICPFKNSDVIAVEIIRSGILIVCPCILIFIIVFSIVYENILCRETKADSRYVLTIDDSVPHYAKLPFIVRIKSTYIQILLIGFASIGVLLFNMINCILINGKKYLYVQASVACYTIWQKIVVVIIASWVVPFFLSLYISCYLLRKCKITPNQFIFISTVPPSVLIYVMKSKLQRDNSSLNLKNAMLAKEILRVVNQPFNNISGKPFKIQWESVLILRRLLLIIVNTFLISPFEKLYPIGFLLVLYLIHHMAVQPYKYFSLNVVEGVSLASLGFLTLLNNFWAFSDEIDITQNPSFMMMGHIFIFIELVILLIPILASFSFLILNLVRKCTYKKTGQLGKLD